MKRQRFWLLAAAALFGVAAWVMAKMSEPDPPAPADLGSIEAPQYRREASDRSGGSPESQPRPARPGMKLNEGTDFPGMRPTPLGSTEPGHAPMVAPANANPAAVAQPDAGALARVNTSPDGGPLTPYAVDRDGIRAAVRAAIPEMQECYDAWRQLQPSLAGNLKVSFFISPDDDAGINRVSQVGLTADSGMGSRAFENCVLGSFGDINFEHSDAGTLVNYPLTFAVDEPPPVP